MQRKEGDKNSRDKNKQPAVGINFRKREKKERAMQIDVSAKKL